MAMVKARERVTIGYDDHRRVRLSDGNPTQDLSHLLLEILAFQELRPMHILVQPWWFPCLCLAPDRKRHVGPGR